MSRTLRGRTAGFVSGATSEDFREPLAHLLTTLKQAPRFMDTWAEFHDEIAMAPDFMELGERARDARLEAALEAVGQKLLGKRYPLSSPAFLRLREHGFWHGTCGFGPRMVIFFYFESADTGLAGVFRHLTDREIELVRFSLVEVPAGTLPSTHLGQA